MMKRRIIRPLCGRGRRVAPGEERNAQAIRALRAVPSALTGPDLSGAAGEVRT
jgi:hypothetical protein